MKKSKWIIAGVTTILLLLICCDMRLKVVTYHVQSEKLEKKIRIALVTDLHGCWYGKNQDNLIEAMEKQNPNVVLLGGDIFDDNVPYEKSEITVKRLAENIGVMILI